MNLRKTLIILSFSILTGAVLFSACTSDEELPVIYPSNDELVTAYITPSSAPAIDGQMDAIWETADKTQLISNDTSEYNPSKKLLIADMFALSDSNNLYVLITWQDNTRNARFLEWKFSGSGWNRPIADRDDNVAIFFQPINNSMGTSLSALAEPNCMSICHATEGVMRNETEFPMDGWYWRSGVTNPIGYAIDLNIVDSLDTDTLDLGVDSEINPGYVFNRPDSSQQPLYWNNEGDSLIADIVIDTITGDPDTIWTYVIDNGEFLFFNDAEEYFTMPVGIVVDSAFVPSFVVYDNASGSRWEVEAKGIYDVSRNRWTVEFKRPLNTGNPDDMVFTIGGEININIAINNNTKINHTGFDPILLKL